MDPITMGMIGSTIGTGIEIVGRWGANIQQSIMEKANAAFYRKQLEFNIAAGQRNLEAVQREAGYRTGQIVGTYGASGLDTSSASALMNIAVSISDGATEILLTKRMQDLEYERLSMAARQSEQRANTLTSLGYNLLQAGTSAAKAGAKFNEAKHSVERINAANASKEG